ncbi:guanine deaminase GuaD [Peptoclostridium acidaminophilum DSM 3953]|uniref:Guanine deaminase n=1 Tax=Peptoclostridium acidaminophilum DSM 3953 TaxID=1286171 RepID=W8THX8_PEPAC|nr:guanine deaminase [Peptoclostridium acidaminophilum]AHM57448.1 guanine deaminase GuaD [Peptoclostridium acidaminophilum DSM 3953]
MNNSNSIKIIKGNIIFTSVPEGFNITEQGFLVMRDGKVEGVYESLPDIYSGIEITDYGDKLIIPGMNDLHCHAPQFRNLGMAMDRELLPWLENYTFPEESRFKDKEYARSVYSAFIREIWKQGTTRIAVYSTVHKSAALQLMELFEKSGLGAYVGKVNMDRNCPDSIRESAEGSLADTRELLEASAGKDSLVRPIITPRFVPSCSARLLEGLGELAVEYFAPVQSHLSENKGEIEWVKELHPDSSCYGDVYDKYKLFGQTPTLMAHCVYSDEQERELMRSRGVIAVHCPTSNMNVGSGMMPVRTFLDEGIRVALGSDISGGHTCSIFKTMVYAIQISKLLWAESGKQISFLSNSETFYMATKGGGSFFGNVGSFEKGYDFDALVIDDSELSTLGYTIEQRLERFIYVGDDRHILHRYVQGKLIEEPEL